ncbi:MAG TPA: hypothetical protein VJ835_08955 [Fimbriimonadaceae bacterium]|nr:hypothetical protein [Fimbriimonadaceae bacterium]
MKSAIRSLLQRVSPGGFQLATSIKNRKLFAECFRDFELEVKRVLYGVKKPKVLHGPFEGMEYLDETVWGSITPRWIGSYECELHEILESLPTDRYENIIDVGCAEGFYAVGLLRKFPKANLLAYDVDLISRRQCGKLAALNGVGNRISIQPYCDQPALQKCCARGSLIVCDIEGSELTLLDPLLAPAIKGADMLVEIHDEEQPVIEETLINRFSETHEVQIRRETSREDWIFHNKQFLEILDESTLLRALDEGRPRKQSWLWLKAIGC